jgi:dihydropteroate synthase
MKVSVAPQPVAARATASPVAGLVGGGTLFGIPDQGRCLIMGIVNVTPDSFSDGGRYLAHDDAVRHGLSLVEAGADVVDVGGESTRPRAARTDESEELRRVVPVVRELARAGVAVTIDTMRSSVAAAALVAGAVGVNDVSGGLADTNMARVIADARVPYVAMHWRSPSKDMHGHARYTDVVGEVIAELGQRLETLERAGVDLQQVVVDPGLGFAKTAAHNWEVLNGLEALAALDRPVLVGASRKSFLRKVIESGRSEVTTEALDTATAVVSALAARSGAHCVRVHDVGSTRTALTVQGCWAVPSRPPSGR